MNMFKIGDKLKASDFDKDQYGIEYVTITSINEKNQVYHWEAPAYGGTVHSGYFFKDAVLYDDEEDISDWDVTLNDGLDDLEWYEEKE